MYRSEAYKAFIRSKPCCYCGNPQSEAHHEPLGRAGMSIKAPDSHCVPLCRSCHQMHDMMGTKTFWASYDVPRMIIKYLTEYLEKLESKYGE